MKVTYKIMQTIGLNVMYTYQSCGSFFKGLGSNSDNNRVRSPYASIKEVVSEVLTKICL